MKDIFDRCNLGNLKLQSRVIRTGLWASQNTKTGRLTDPTYRQYEKIASSCVGMITTELITLYPKDKFSNLSHKLYNIDFVHDFKIITDIAHKNKVPILGQLAFVQYNRGIDLDIKVNDLTIQDIRNIQVDLISACKKLSFAGFDGVQLALGNNFFLSKFINPYYNQRDDNYGGDTFSRMRIILETIKVIKDNLNLHINCRINAYDGRKGGIDSDESIKMCQLLAEYGADSIQITKPLSPLYFTKENINDELIDYYTHLKDYVQLPIIVGGGLNDKQRIDELLNCYDVDFVSMYRPFVAQNDFLVDWKNNRNLVSRCKLCNNCYRQKNSTCYHFD